MRKDKMVQGDSESCAGTWLYMTLQGIGGQLEWLDYIDMFYLGKPHNLFYFLKNNYGW